MTQFFRRVILVRSRVIERVMLPAVSDKIIAGCKPEGRGIYNNDAHHLKRFDAGSYRGFLLRLFFRYLICDQAVLHFFPDGIFKTGNSPDIPHRIDTVNQDLSYRCDAQIS
jgi:hypothetical protein